MPPIAGGYVLEVTGALGVLGTIALGLKRVRTEMVEVARETAKNVATEAIEKHVTEKHDPLAESLTEIKVGVARIEAHLAERQIALADRVTNVEDRCAEAVKLGLCNAGPGGGK